jgi:hypothetical protein
LERREKEMATISAAKFQTYLKGISYPANKAKLLDTARRNGAPEDVIKTINSFSDMEFASPIEVEKQFSSKAW